VISYIKINKKLLIILVFKTTGIRSVLGFIRTTEKFVGVASD